MATVPRVVVFGGINGAGKSTSAGRILRAYYPVPAFVNADAIAKGLDGLHPERAAVEAGRVMLDYLGKLFERRADVAIESTLSARTYARFLSKLRGAGYFVRIEYVWLKSAEAAIDRVKERVAGGGHHIPEDDIRRRYPRATDNFLTLYRPLADVWNVYDNSDGKMTRVAYFEDGAETVLDPVCLDPNPPECPVMNAIPPRRTMPSGEETLALARLAVKEAVLEHARMGRSVSETHGDKLVWVPPAEIFARYGFDEFGRPIPGWVEPADESPAGRS